MTLRNDSAQRLSLDNSRRGRLGTLAAALLLTTALTGCGQSDYDTDENISAVTAATAPAWAANVSYQVGNLVTYNGRLYKVLAAHTSLSTWTPDIVPALFQDLGAATSTSPAPTPAPAPAPAAGCTFTTWSAGIYYTLGAIVKYPANGSYYKLVNVGTRGSDGTDPTISTWYWSPTTCSTTTPPPPPPSSSGFVVTEAQFNQMFPNRSSFYTYAGLVAALSTFPAFANTGSDTVRKQEAAAFLANVAHESDNLRAVREYNTANYPLYCSHGVGNCGGKEYYGRGPIQLSWDYNYAAAGSAIGADLLNNPDLVATNAAIAWRTGIWYWMTGTGSAGTTPHNAMISSQGFGVTIRAINGALECNGGRPDQVQSRINYYKTFTGILGVAPGSNLSC
jgi:predicted chitinase/chitodextrinase